MYFFDCVSNALDTYLSTYDKFILAGDFNIQEHEQALSEFLDKYNANNLVKDKTCFKSIENPSCVDLLITNSFKSFQNTTVISTGCSDFHKMSLTVLKSKFIKAKPKVIYYRDYTLIKNDQNSFKETLRRELSNCKSYEQFEQVFLDVVNKSAPLKAKKVRANQAPYMTKTLRKAIMTRSRLQRKLFSSKTQTNERLYKKQKQIVSRLYKKERLKFYKSIDPKIVQIIRSSGIT